METYHDEVARLQAEVENERLLRLEAEAEADSWRQKTIDVKLDSLHKRREASAAMEEIAVDSRINRATTELDENAAARMKNEVENLKQQREMLLKTLEDMQGSGEESEEEKKLPPLERLEREKERRRAAEGLAKALRTMFDDVEANRTSLQHDAEKLKADNERTRNLLTAAQDLMIQNRISPQATALAKSDGKQTAISGDSGSSKNALVFFSTGAVIGVVAAMLVFRRM